MPRAKSLLDHDARRTRTEHEPRPRIGDFFHARPKRVLVLLIPRQVALLDRILLLISLFLARFRLSVAADPPEEQVIGDRPKKLDRCEHIRAVQQEREGEVDQCVTKVAGS